VERVLDLGFGKCKLQVQVPEKGEIQRPEGLVGKNVVTSFVGLTEQYFARLEGLDNKMVNGDGDVPVRNRLRTKIKYVGGSVEAACALGVADGIVDLVGESVEGLIRRAGVLTTYRVWRNNESSRPQSHRHRR
jgi:ATP phosphoribosyltransferase